MQAFWKIFLLVDTLSQEIYLQVVLSVFVVTMLCVRVIIWLRVTQSLHVTRPVSLCHYPRCYNLMLGLY